MVCRAVWYFSQDFLLWKISFLPQQQIQVCKSEALYFVGEESLFQRKKKYKVADTKFCMKGKMHFTETEKRNDKFVTKEVTNFKKLTTSLLLCIYFFTFWSFCQSFSFLFCPPPGISFLSYLSFGIINNFKKHKNSLESRHYEKD